MEKFEDKQTFRSVTFISKCWNLSTIPIQTKWLPGGYNLFDHFIIPQTHNPIVLLLITRPKSKNLLLYHLLSSPPDLPSIYLSICKHFNIILFPSISFIISKTRPSKTFFCLIYSDPQFQKWVLGSFLLFACKFDIIFYTLISRI